MSLVLLGSTSGSVTLQEPAIAGSTVIDLPATSGTMAVTGGSPSFTNITATGNLTFTGTGNRITGDFSNATIANRVGFQSSTTNGNTTISVIPNGTATVSGVNFYGASDITNANQAQFAVVNGSDIRIQSGATGSASYVPMTFYTGGSERMRIDSSGKVGIGTNLPTQKLEVSGGIYISGSATLGTAMASTLSYEAPVSRYYVGDGTGYSWAFSKRASSTTTDLMTITDTGNVGIGVTSISSKLQIDAASQSAVYARITAGTNPTINSYVGYASSTSVAALRCVKYDNNSTTSQVFVQFAINQDGANNGQINANGASTAAFGSYSDARLKENIVDLPSQLGNIMALRPVEFDYIGVEDGHQIGFIAQEMQQVYPDAVSVGNDEMLMITAWSKTEARLVKAIQELKSIIDTQASTITQLQADVAALKGQA